MAAFYAQLVAWSLHHRGLVLVLAVVVTALGLQSAQRLPVDVLPDLTRPTVSVHVEAPGYAASDVEARAAVPVETALSGLPGVVRVRSVSSPALAVVYAEFDWNTDPYRNRQLVAERLDAMRAQLPDGLQPRIGPLASLMGEVMLIALQSDDAALDAMALRDLADWSLRPALLAVRGVAQVVTIGGDTRQYEVRPDPARMRLLGVSLDELEAATRGFGSDIGAGFVDVGGQELTLRTRGQPFEVDALRDLAVSSTQGAPILLQQVADVGIGAKPRRGAAGADGQPAVILAIQKQAGADTLALTAELERRLGRLATALPATARLTTLFRQADFIEKSVHNVREALALGALIVAVVLYAFLASARATWVSLAAIPLSLLTAILVLRGCGQSINTMTLGGLAIAVGELVDDAVVGVENIARRLRERGSEPPLRVIARATVEVRSGILYATLIIILVLVPLFGLDGIEGRLFAPLAIAYIAAIAASLVVAVTLSPVLSSLAFSAGGTALPREQAWLQALKHRYVVLLERVLHRPQPLFGAAVALLLVTAVLGAQLPRAFLPAFSEGSLTVNLLLRPGISLAESDRLGRVAETLLREIPDVAHVGRRTGRAELDEHAEGVHYSELDVALRDDGRQRDEVLATIRAKLAPLPGSVTIGQPISHRLDHLLSGVRAPFVVKLAGDDLAILQSLAENVRTELQRLPGLTDTQIEQQQAVPTLDLRVDPRRAAQYGLSAVRAQRAIAELSAGKPLAEIADGEQRHALVLRLDDAARTPAALADLPIDTPQGPVALSWIADLIPTQSPGQILREDLRRRLVVYAFAAQQNFARDSALAEQGLRALTLPAGYELHVEGQLQAQRSALLQLAELSVLSLLLMLAVLYGRYRSWRLSAIILGNVPLALAGGVLALAITGTPLSVASLVGFVTLAGIATRNGILKISHYVHLGVAAGYTHELGPILRGSAERLTPVLMTALIAALALLPLLWSGDAPGKEILHPVALVIFGGLISSTLLDSFVTPALYWRIAAPVLARMRSDEEHKYDY